MPTASECAKKHKKGTQAYKDCIAYRGKYKKNISVKGGGRTAIKKPTYS